MSFRVAVIEVEGGRDKWLSGRRKDTLPIVGALQQRGVETHVLVYRPEWSDELTAYMVGTYDAYISRVNPGTIPGGDNRYFAFLRGLTSSGMLGMSHPDDMMRLGAKDSLAKLAGTGLVPDDTVAYRDFAALSRGLPRTLSRGDRVLKQNRGAAGQGIWRVEVVDEYPYASGFPLPLDTRVRCTEAVDNHAEEHSLEEFMERCREYLIGDDGLIVDMRFLPRITEGEIRILMVGEEPVSVVHKKPAERDGAFSATLFSGATYTYDDPANWQPLIDHFLRAYPTARRVLGDICTPLIWTADFMLDTDAAGRDAYVLGEFNCSCAGFTSQLDRGIQDVVADEAVRRLRAWRAERTEGLAATA